MCSLGFGDWVCLIKSLKVYDICGLGPGAWVYVIKSLSKGLSL